MKWVIILIRNQHQGEKNRELHKQLENVKVSLFMGYTPFPTKGQLEKNASSDLGFNEEFYLLSGQRLKLMLLCKPYFLSNLNRCSLIICFQLRFSHLWFSFVALTQLKLLRIVTLVLSKISFLVLQQKVYKKVSSAACASRQSQIWGIESGALWKLLIACHSSAAPAVHTFLLST